MIEFEDSLFAIHTVKASTWIFGFLCFNLFFNALTISFVNLPEFQKQTIDEFLTKIWEWKESCISKSYTIFYYQRLLFMESQIAKFICQSGPASNSLVALSTLAVKEVNIVSLVLSKLSLKIDFYFLRI